MVTLNGEQMDLNGAVLKAYLEASGWDLKRIAVERNGEIVPKSQYGETVLKDGDTVEIVTFVGGG